jgi:hypothetical protein
VLLGATASLLLAAITVGPAAAASKTNCGNASSGWTEISTEGAAALMWPTLLDPSIFGSEANLAAAIEGDVDANGDATVCLKQIWGDHLNPNSNWYIIGVDAIGSPTVASTVHDNNANGS